MAVSSLVEALTALVVGASLTAATVTVTGSGSGYVIDNTITVTDAKLGGGGGASLTFDVSSKSSFDHLSFWLKEIKKHNSEKNLSIIVAANKVDKHKQRVIYDDEIRVFCDEHQLQFLETSARTHHNTKLLFMTLINNILINNITAVGKSEGIKIAADPLEDINRVQKTRDYCPTCL